MQSLRSRHKFPDKPQLYSMTVFATQCRWTTREHKTAGDINALWYRSTRRTYLSKFHEGRAVWYVTWGLFQAPQGVCRYLHIITIHWRSLTNSPQNKHAHNARNHFAGEFKNIGSDLSLWNVITSAYFRVYAKKFQQVTYEYYVACVYQFTGVNKDSKWACNDFLNHNMAYK
jgi:hypothetical protein